MSHASHWKDEADRLSERLQEVKNAHSRVLAERDRIAEYAGLRFAEGWAAALKVIAVKGGGDNQLYLLDLSRNPADPKCEVCKGEGFLWTPRPSGGVVPRYDQKRCSKCATLTKTPGEPDMTGIKQVPDAQGKEGGDRVSVDMEPLTVSPFQRGMEEAAKMIDQEARAALSLASEAQTTRGADTMGEFAERLETLAGTVRAFAADDAWVREVGPCEELPFGADVPSADTIAVMLPSLLASSECPLCGRSGFHQHSAEEIVIYRNGVKYGRSLTGVEPSGERHPGKYHATTEDGRWFVASPSGQTIVAGPFHDEAAAKAYASGLNSRRAGLAGDASTVPPLCSCPDVGCHPAEMAEKVCRRTMRLCAPKMAPPEAKP